ncbi:MAG: hypothetical protein WCX48_05985 [Bacteroidales bacterium]
MQADLREVKTPHDIKKFIRFSHKLYKGNKQYVPALDFEEFNTLTKSPSLEYCKIKMWLAYSKDNKIVGRIAGILNPGANEFHGCKRVRFGWFDFINDVDVAGALLDKVIQWGKEEGMAEIHGPLGYNTWNRQGMLVKGFENTPPSNCLYNYSYYPEIMDKLGYKKQMDWLQIKLYANVGVPDKLRKINELLLEKHNLKILDLKEVKDIDSLVDRFFKSYNQSFRNIDNFSPITPNEVKAIGKNYFPKLRPELTNILLDDKENIAAFGICFPSLSEALKKAKGKLFPFGWYHIMRGVRKYDTIDLMMLGAAPEWQNKGISSIIHTHLATIFKERDIKFAISNPQAENNLIHKVWDRYENFPYMTRRCYIKNI